MSVCRAWDWCPDLQKQKWLAVSAEALLFIQWTVYNYTIYVQYIQYSLIFILLGCRPHSYSRQSVPALHKRRKLQCQDPDVHVPVLCIERSLMTVVWEGALRPFLVRHQTSSWLTADSGCTRTPPTPRGLIGCATRMPSKARDTGLYLDDAVDAHIGIEAKATIFSFHSSAYAYSCKKLLEEVWYLLALVVQQQGLLRDDRCLQSHCIQLYWMLKAAGNPQRTCPHMQVSEHTDHWEFPFPLTESDQSWTESSGRKVNNKEGETLTTDVVLLKIISSRKLYNALIASIRAAVQREK